MTRSCNHCDGLSRSRFLHRALAEAGQGLPAIEPGMPLPAGTGLSRRRFLAGSLGAAVAIYGGSRLGFRAFEEGIASAASGPAAPILVSVFLEGGADGLSVLSPQGIRSTRSFDRNSRSPAGPRSPRTTASTGIRRSPGSSSSTPRRR